MKVSGKQDRINGWRRISKPHSFFASSVVRGRKSSAYVCFCSLSKAAKVLMLSTAGTLQPRSLESILNTARSERGVRSFSESLVIWSLWNVFYVRLKVFSIVLTVNTPHFLTIKGVEVNAGQTASFHCTVNGRKRDNFRLWLQVRPTCL